MASLLYRVVGRMRYECLRTFDDPANHDNVIVPSK